MKLIKILNGQRQVMAIIQSDLYVQTEDNQLKKQIEGMLQKAKHEGIPTRSGGLVEKNGKKFFVEELIKVHPHDDNFLEALSDLIAQTKFSDTRYFGIIEEE